MMMLVAYMDRVNISVAGPNIVQDLHFSKTQFGLILGAFSLGYALLQIPGGALSDRFGSKPMLILGILAWSVFTGLTGLCSGLVAILVVRVLFGASEGLENGAQFKVIGDRFSPEERSKANGLFLSALAIGPAIASPLSTFLIQRLGWRAMFFTYSLAGVVAAIVLLSFLPSEPRSEPNREPLWQALRSGEAAKLALTYFLFNVAFWGFVGWMPTYLKEQRHVALANLGWIGSIPYGVGALGLIGAGLLGAKFSDRRKFLASAAYVLGAAALVGTLASGSVELTIVALSVAAFGLYASFAPFWSVALDSATASNRGAFTGAINFCGQLGGFFGQLTIGIIAQKTGSFWGVMLLMGAALLGSSICVLSVSKPAIEQT
jgi:MFS family permease